MPNPAFRWPLQAEDQHLLTTAGNARAALLVGVGVTVAIAALDVLVPLGVAVGVLYVVIVLISFRLPHPNAPLIAALGCTALIVLGLVFSPTGGEQWKVLANRLASIAVVWGTFWFMRQFRRSEVLLTERKTALTEQANRLRAMTSELVLAEHRERRQLAIELHDYLAQLLVVTQLKLNSISHASVAPWVKTQHEEIAKLLDQALTYCRTLVAELSPRVLYELGFLAALKQLAGQMRKYGLTVSTDMNTQTATMAESQAILLYQTVRELLFNVVKHAGVEHASVSVTVEEGRAITLTVADEGKGFDPSVLEDPAKRHTKFGLLNILERIHAMGGECRIDSAPGTGTRVTIVSPLHTQPSVSSARSMPDPVARTPVASATPIRVILVDDHILMREGLRAVLDTYPEIQVVGEAGNGEDAVEQARALQPDVVIMDVQMPRMDGIAATRAIARTLPRTKVIGLSYDPATARAMIEAGAIVQIDKAAATSELHRCIHDAMGRRRTL